MYRVLGKRTTSIFRVEYSTFSSLISQSFILKKEPACSFETLLQFTYLKNQSQVPKGFQEVKFPRLRDNGPGWW